MPRQKKRTTPYGGRWWIYTSTGVQCTGCLREEAYSGQDPYTVFDRISHEGSCPAAGIPGGKVK